MVPTDEVEVVDIEACDFFEVAAAYAEAWRGSHPFLPRSAVESFDALRAATVLAGIAASGGRLSVAVRADVPLGVVAVVDEEISKLYVHPRAQNRGVGSMLLRHACAGCKEPTINVLTTNRGAQRLYFRHGFRFTGKQQPFHDDILELEMVGPSYLGAALVDA